MTTQPPGSRAKAPSGGRMGGHANDAFHRPSRPFWGPLMLILGAIAIGYQLKPQEVTVNNGTINNGEQINIWVAEGAPKQVVEYELNRLTGRHIETPPLYFSDCEDDPFFGTEEEYDRHRESNRSRHPVLPRIDRHGHLQPGPF